MSTTEAPRLQEVKRVSGLLRGFFKFLFAMTVLSLIVMTLSTLMLPNDGEFSVELAGIQFSGAELTGRIRVMAAISALLGLGVSLKAFYHLIRLFGLYAAGHIFTADNVGQIRQLGITLMLFSLAWLFQFGSALPAISSSVDEWARIVPSFPMLELVGGAIVILVSWIMEVGRELREEHDLVV